ncbi:hypothetical protein CEE36_03050 [candidate division TA06 bacterium B3_TA06]|uniref:Capsule assembly Wzi family protein n=1 Tax=candidate division TA06 bacterium B3_TA06 TaxID=2012487 RepID=A0A532V940_UNCT6|nr:MAG: hypothetical protein CEE36_03050 [candidate division TA06 bacterium B3_TA06]
MILGLVGVSYGQVEINGQYENVLSVQHIKNFSILDLNNLLFSVEGDLGSSSFLHADAEASLPFGSVDVNLLDFVPDSLADMIPDSLRSLYDYKLEPSFRISNAYMSISWKRLVVRLGKQPLAWGTGYVWNPTEIIAPRLAYDPSYRRDGENALRLSYSWRYGGGAEVIGVLRGRPDSSMAILRLKENLLGFDLAAIGAWLWDTTTTPDTTRRRLMLGGQFAGEIGNIGLWAEGGYNLYEEDPLSYAEFVVGADHTFTFRTHVMAEYLYYGRGFDSADDYTFTGWLERASGLRKAMGQHLLYVGADQTIISFHNVGISAIVSPVDGSGIVIPRLSLNLADNLDLSAFGLISFGDEESEFGAAPVKGGILRLTGYF